MTDRKGIGNYRFTQELGKGCYGKVYKANKIGSDEDFAVKVVDKKSLNKSKKLVELFATEVQVMKEIEHPNILKCYELLESDSNYYMILQYCNGGDLANHLKTHQTLSEEEAVFIMKQIINGFCELNAQKVMHRDFKLANVFLHNDNVVIGDFGFAKSGIEITSTKLGSPLTMAPEIMMAGSKSSYDSRVDIWSIGVVFYNLLYGDVPWQVETQDQLKEQITMASGESLFMPSHPQVSNQCKQLLKKMIEIDLEKRIGWKELFAHPLFELKIGSYESLEVPPSPSDALEIKRSIMFRPHEDSVDALFKRNQEVQDTATPSRKRGIFQTLVKVFDLNNVMSKSDQKKNEQCIDRYFHEKKTINFIFLTSRKLIKIYKQFITKSPDFFEPFFILSLLLTKKAERMHSKLAISLSNKKNIFELQGFDTFVDSSEGQKILEELLQEHVVYDSTLTKLCDITPQLIRAQKAAVGGLMAICKTASLPVRSLTPQLRSTFAMLTQTYSILAKLAGDLASKLDEYYAKAFLCVEHEKAFAACRSDGSTFDWQLFDGRVHTCAFVESIVKQAQTTSHAWMQV